MSMNYKHSSSNMKTGADAQGTILLLFVNMPLHPELRCISHPLTEEHALIKRTDFSGEAQWRRNLQTKEKGMRSLRIMSDESSEACLFTDSVRLIFRQLFKGYENMPFKRRNTVVCDKRQEIL